MKFFTHLLDWLKQGKTIFKKGGRLVKEAETLKKNMKASIEEIRKDGLGLDDLPKIQEQGKSLIAEAKTIRTDTQEILEKKTGHTDGFS